MDQKLEQGPTLPTQERSKAARLPPRDSYPLTEAMEAWKHDIDRNQVVDYIRLGKLTCCILLEDQPVKVYIRSHREFDMAERRSLDGPRYGVIRGDGYYRLEPADAVSAYYRTRRRPHLTATTGPALGPVTEEDQQILLEPPYRVGWLRNWLASRRDLRITHEERERFARECGIGLAAHRQKTARQQALQRVHDLAKAKWERAKNEGRKITQAAMFRDPEIKAAYGAFSHTEKRFRELVNDIAPSSRGGRPPKTSPQG